MSSTLREGSPTFEKAETDPHSIDRGNVLLLTRLVIRGLLEFCMQSKNRWLNAEQPHLVNLFVMLEKVLRHGFKSNRTLITLRTPEQELWNLIEKLAKNNSEVNNAVTCVQQLPNVHTSISRVRAWLRLALMQKKLSDYFQLLIDSKSLLFEYYDDFSLLRNETEAVVLCGSLIGLRVIDCNLYLKEEDLSRQLLNVDLSWYIKIPTVSVDTSNGSLGTDLYAAETAKELKNILDQKNYLEERNRQLSANVINLEKRLAVMEGMRKCRESVSSIGSAEDTKPIECQDVEVLPALTTVDQLQTAMDSMEKSMHEKQDTIVDLHQQIDDVKKINLDLYHKLRLAEEQSRKNEKVISQLEKQIEKERTQAKRDSSTAENKLAEKVAALKKADTSVQNLQMELQKKTEFCSDIQSQLADSLNSNEMLKESRSVEQLTREELQSRIASLSGAEQETMDLKLKCQNLERKVDEYERTLEEMGHSMARSKLTVEDLKEGLLPLAEAEWESDKESMTCKQCDKKFSVALRKHHCRNCGRIYCDKCSENTMPLPSSSKPVRVCDSCYALLLQRFSAKSLAS